MHRFKTAAFFFTVLVHFTCIPCLLAGETADDPFRLETITVTAEKQETDVQKTSSPISVFSKKQLEDGDIEEIGEVVKQIPNMNFGTTFLGKDAVFRGIRPSQFTNKNTVAIYIDGIPHDSIYDFDADLNNVARVEVLRGSQGALYGKNTIGGIINIVSEQPDNDFNSHYSTETDENQTYRFKGCLEGPVIEDRLFAGISGSWSQTDGFMENRYPGADNFDENRTARVKALLKWLPSDRLTLDLHAGASRIRDDNGAVIRADEVRYYGTRDPEDNNDLDVLDLGLGLAYDWDDLELHAVSTLGKDDVRYRQNLNYFVAADKWIGSFDMETTRFSQEIRLQSKDGGNAPFTWLGGIFFSHEKEDIFDATSLVNQVASLGYNIKKNWTGTTDSDTMSVFGQTNFPLFGALSFTAGLRYEHIDKELTTRYQKSREDTGALLDGSAFDTGADWDALLPKGILSWQIRENARLYASIAKGYLAGGLNAYETNKENAKFDAQTSLDYEIGVKTEWFDNRLFFNLNLFYMDIKDIHVYTMPSPSIFVASNEGEAHSTGIEAEITAKPVKGFDLNARFGLIEAEYDDYKGYEGRTIQGTPDYTMALSAQYRHDSGFFMRTEILGNGRTYYNDTNTDSQSSYAVVNAKIGYEWTHWALSLYCRNVFDEAYFSYGRSCGIGTIKEVGDPRTIGVIASVSF